MVDINAEVERAVRLTKTLQSLTGREVLAPSDIADLKKADPKQLHAVNDATEARLAEPKVIAYISLCIASGRHLLNDEKIDRILDNAEKLSPEQLQQENRRMLDALPEERRDHIKMKVALDKQEGREPDYASIIKQGTTRDIADLAKSNEYLRTVTGDKSPAAQTPVVSGAKRPGGKLSQRPDWSVRTDSGEYEPDINLLLRDVKGANKQQMDSMAKGLREGYAINQDYYDKLQASIDRNTKGKDPATQDKLGQLSEAIDRGRLNEHVRDMTEKAFDAAKSSPPSAPNRTNPTQRSTPGRP